MAKIINGMPLKEADTNLERALLGLIAKTSNGIAYGRVVINIAITKGKITHIECSEIRHSLKADTLDRI